MKILKDKYIIILIIIITLGFALRIVGFNFDYLFDSVSDENYPNSCVLRMINNRTLIPNNCGNPYPALYTLINLPSILTGLLVLFLKNNFNLDVFKQLIALYPFASTLLLVRLFAVAIGTANIFLIYKITKNIFRSQLKGLIASAFLAFSVLPVQLSHWGKAWTLVLFFTFLSLHSAILIYQKGERKHYILNAVFTSSAFGIHYGGFFSVIFIFLGHFFRTIWLRSAQAFSFKEFFRNNKNLYLSLVLSLFLSAIWALLNWQGVFNFLFSPNEGVSQYYKGGGLNQYFSSIFYYFKDFLMFDPVLFLILAVCLIFNFRKFLTPRYLFFILFFIFYLIGMALIDFGNKIRWLMPLIAISIPLAADFLGDLRVKFKSGAVYTAVIIALLLPSLFFSSVWDYIITLPGTRFAAKDWIEKNIPENSKILFLDITLILAVSQEGAQDLNEALAEVRPPNPRYLYLTEKGQSVLPGYRVVSWGQFLDNPKYPEWSQFDYYILSYISREQYQEKLALLPPLEELRLIHQIRPFSSSGIRRSFREGRDAPLEYLRILKDLKMTGPTIEIYVKR